MIETKKTERLMLDVPMGRYNLVAAAMEWMKVIRQTDEGRVMSQAEIIKTSLDDIISGRVSVDEVHGAMAKLKTPEAAAEAAPGKDAQAGEFVLKSKKDEKSKK